MYDQDGPACQRWAQQSPDNLADVITFALLSIRQPIERVPADLLDVRKRGAESSTLWAFKRQGFEYAQAHRGDLYLLTRLCDRQNADADLLLALLDVPGLGLAKAGFIAQLAFGRVGCLDSHNLRRLGLDYRDFNVSSTGPDTTRERTAAYVRACRAAGGVAQLWDDWCAYVAALRPDVFEPFAIAEDCDSAADAVSRIHTLALGIERVA